MPDWETDVVVLALIITFILAIVIVLLIVICCCFFCHFKNVPCWETCVCFFCCHEFNRNRGCCCQDECWCDVCCNYFYYCCCGCLEWCSHTCCYPCLNVRKEYEKLDFIDQTSPQDDDYDEVELETKKGQYRYDINYHNSWKKYPNPEEYRREWLSMKVYLIVYSLLLVLYSFVAIFLAHIIPVFDPDSWRNCQANDEISYYHINNQNGTDEAAVVTHVPVDQLDSNQYTLCVLAFHVYEIPTVCIWLAAAFAILFKWSHLNSSHIINTMLTIDITLFIFGLFEVILTFLGSRRAEFPFYQMLLFLTWTVMCFFLAAFGTFVRQKLLSFVHPQNVFYDIVYVESEDEICRLIEHANANGTQIRCVGSEHSKPSAIYVDRPYVFNASNTFHYVENDILISLDNYRSVVRNGWDDEHKRVTVQAGMLLGENREGRQWSTEENSLCFKLEQKRWALDDTGGVIKQSVAGFTV